MKYFKDSFIKFKNDALSKVFYDLLEYIFISFVLVAILKFTPVIKEKLEANVSITLWALLTLSLLLIGICVVTCFMLFNKKYKQIQAKSHIDELTGLKNHKALGLDLEILENNWDAKLEPVSIILFDIDDFKKFNENNSYEVADKILTKLGGLFSKDRRITDETYRYFMRGDEFLIIARQTSISNAQNAAERKRKLIEDSSFEIDGTDFKLTVSCGVTEYNRGESKTEVLERASRALQNAKKKPKKNCTEIIV